MLIMENYYETLIHNMYNHKEADKEAIKEFIKYWQIIKNEPDFKWKAMNILRNSSTNYVKEYFNNFSPELVDHIFKAIRKEYLILCPEGLSWLMSLDSLSFVKFLCYFKAHEMYLGNVESVNRKKFPEWNLPIIRIMDYCLENAYFEKYDICAQKLEKWAIKAYWNARKSFIAECIEKYRNKSGFWLIFSNTSSAVIKEYITEQDIPNLSSFVCYKLFEQRILLPIELMDNQVFYDVFKKFQLHEQIALTELLEKVDFSNEVIQKLHKLFNKTKISNFDCIHSTDIYLITNYYFEMSKKKFERMYDEIRLSSYFTKNNIEKDEFWAILDTLQNNPEDLNGLINIKTSYYHKLMELYEKCFRYATESIVSSLYPLNTLEKKVTYMEDAKYNILCRTQTLFDLSNLYESFEKRRFSSFSIITQDNFSHYLNSVIFGYYSRVAAPSIAHIFPQDSLSKSWAMYRSDLTTERNMFLDIDDLNNTTYALKTYNQLCIETKGEDNKILKPDAIICTEEVNEESLKSADQYGINILVLKRNKNTIENNRDIYEDLQ